MTYSLKYMGFRLRQKTAGGNFFYFIGNFDFGGNKN